MKLDLINTFKELLPLYKATAKLQSKELRSVTTRIAPGFTRFTSIVSEGDTTPWPKYSCSSVGTGES